jgi:4-hydroxy-tetrahydrodipicolinate synthase
MDWSGVWVAVVTPFSGGAVDQKALERLVDDLAEAGVTGIVPVGCTGEAIALDPRERGKVIERVIKSAGGRCRVVPGTGLATTQETVEASREAERHGADGVMVMSPFTNKPPQDALVTHYRTVASSVGLPVMIYNIAGRTGVNLTPATIAQIAEGAANVEAVKEASGDVDQISAICAETGLAVLSGDDSLTLPILSVGGIGVVSVIGHLVPEDLGAMIRAALEGRRDDAIALHRKMLPLAKALFVEPNPIPVKAALAWQGRIPNELRPPLRPLAEAHAPTLRAAMEAAGVPTGAERPAAAP